mgnify:CR=1 FL=1
MKVGDLVKSKYTIGGHRGRVGIVIQMREGAYENQPLAQVYWPHPCDTGWVEAIDMEVIHDA